MGKLETSEKGELIETSRRKCKKQKRGALNRTIRERNRKGRQGIDTLGSEGIDRDIKEETDIRETSRR